MTARMGSKKKNLSISSNNTSFSAPIIWDFVTVTYLKAFDKILDRKIMVQEYVDENLKNFLTQFKWKLGC